MKTRTPGASIEVNSSPELFIQQETSLLEAFVIHDNSPTALPLPHSKGYWIFRICSCLKKSHLWFILAEFGQFLVAILAKTVKGTSFVAVNCQWSNSAETVKRYIYTPRPFILAYNQISITFRSKVLARTSSYFEKPLFWPNSATSGGCQKAHLHINIIKIFHLCI